MKLRVAQLRYPNRLLYLNGCRNAPNRLVQRFQSRSIRQPKYATAASMTSCMTSRRTMAYRDYRFQALYQILLPLTLPTKLPIMIALVLHHS